MDLSGLTTNHWMMIAGALLILVGFLLQRRAARHDLKEAVLESAWHAARGRRTSDNPTEVERRLNDIVSQPTSAGKVTAAASTVVGHFVAQVVSLISIVMMLAGAALAAAGWFWV
jgi:hypothetical protein